MDRQVKRNQLEKFLHLWIYLSISAMNELNVNLAESK